VVLTRTDSADPKHLEELVLKSHPKRQGLSQPDEIARMDRRIEWRAVAFAKIQAQKVAAFCGIGNPRAFFADLRHWGFSLVEEDAFPDHHVYTGEEIQRLVARRQQERCNRSTDNPKRCGKALPGLDAAIAHYGCEIEAQILNTEDFEKTLMTFLEKARA
jgi:hypothetical protein